MHLVILPNLQKCPLNLQVYITFYLYRFMELSKVMNSAYFCSMRAESLDWCRKIHATN